MTPDVIAYDNGTSFGTATLDDCSYTDDRSYTVEWIPVDYYTMEVFYSEVRKRRFLAGGLVEFYDGWFDEENDRFRLRLIYVREPVGERKAGIGKRNINIVRRSKNRGRHWDRKSA